MPKKPKVVVLNNVLKSGGGVWPILAPSFATPFGSSLVLRIHKVGGVCFGHQIKLGVSLDPKWEGTQFGTLKSPQKETQLDYELGNRFLASKPCNVLFIKHAAYSKKNVHWY